jgi:hypothetical protein
MSSNIIYVAVDNVIYRCNTQLLWDVWWSGNTSKKYAPYRGLHQRDLEDHHCHANLSKAKKVMGVVLSFAGEAHTARTIAQLTIAQRDIVFSSAFLAMALVLYPGADAAEIDRLRIGNMSYLTLYDLINKHNREHASP